MSVDDLTRARAARIAKQRTQSEIRNAIRAFASPCPFCGAGLRDHTDSELNHCAVRGTQPMPEGA